MYYQKIVLILLLCDSKIYLGDYMIIKIVIAGCRNFSNYKLAKEFIDLSIADICGNNEIVIISGGAKGADSIGEHYAKENGFEIQRFPADWKRYGRGAGPKRNKEMAEYCDFAICFWDGKSKGTKSMIGYAEKLGKTVKIKYI